ncbi:Rab3 GTPase-activating protein catalytic subunit [Dinochytrium kinnereticum]|nr:Rab3 GTPase-activating protein catalytic subunit [Dinochytrium kinnereticum]
MLTESLNEILRDWLPQLTDSESNLYEDEPQNDKVDTQDGDERIGGDKRMSRIDSTDGAALRALQIGRKAVFSALGTDIDNIDLARDVGVIDMHDIRDGLSALFIDKPLDSRDEGDSAFLDTVISRIRGSVSVPRNSFFWVLSRQILDSISPLATTRLKTKSDGFAKMLWAEITKELRSRWESADLIPLVFFSEAEQSSHIIDLRHSILYQKLYMLNCCIARKKLPLIKRVVTERVGEAIQNSPQDSHIALSREGGRKREGVVSLLSNLASQTINDMSSGFLPDLGLKSRNLREGAGTLLENIFDRLTSDEALPAGSLPDAPLSGKGVRIPPPGLQATNGVGSWSSDRSWELYADHADSKKQDVTARTIHNAEVSEGSPAKSHEIFFDTIERESELSDVIRKPSVNDRLSAISSGRYESNTSASQIMIESFIELGSDLIPGDLKFDHGELQTLPPTEETEEDLAIVEPEGAAEEDSGLNLINGEPLRIPYLQEPCLMTEDMIIEQEQIFEKLGTSAEATKIRARMQCAQLKSDMEAFKAANPRCTLADFVRWHSPRDWLEDSKGGGRLSLRMQEPGNLWEEIWKASQRIPAKRQKPLFNIETEAEKALFYFETLPIAELLSMLIPVIFLVAFHDLSSHPLIPKIPSVAKEVNYLGNEISKYSWTRLESGSLSELLNYMSKAERSLSLSISLSKKLPLQYDLISCIVKNGSSKANKLSERDTVLELISEVSPTKSPIPDSLEYVFRCILKVKEKKLGQRMYALVKSGETRVTTTLVDRKCI